LILHGYEATFLIDICTEYVKARDEGKLHGTQIAISQQADILIRACAKTGIIALIDEATGYQQHRAKQALQLKFQAFIAEELQEWAKMFPEEFWETLARLENVEYSAQHRPLRWGRYVMLFVYDAIDSDIGKELRKKNPNPHFKKNHHQWLKEFGREKVTAQIYRVIGIMKTCRDIDDFKRKFARIFDKQTAFDFMLDD